MQRKHTRAVNVGAIQIGGDAPISIQSMTNTDTRDTAATIAQIERLAAAGCDIVRVSVPDQASAEALPIIKKAISLPLVADIHFDYRLALAALAHGVDKLRLNPGNIGEIDNVKKVVAQAKERGIPIRIGVNGGSLDPKFHAQHGGVTAEAVVASAKEHIGILEALDFGDIIVSVKCSSVPLTIAAYQLLHAQTDYPLHLGVTESGTKFGGTVKSSVGIGALLAMGIGDTLRVSLTEDPVEEIHLAKELLKALELRKDGVTFVSCPTCARTKVDLIPIAKEVEARCATIRAPLTVAVMGCVVNGPGEAKHADFGIACGVGSGVLFEKGNRVGVFPEHELVNALLTRIEAANASETTFSREIESQTLKNGVGLGSPHNF